MTTSADRLLDPLLAPLLDALLAARTQPAADQFDAALAAAVAGGAVSADLARQLRYWQRASVHEVTDHVRTVLPVVLPTALCAVSRAAEEATAASASASDVWSGGRGDPPAAPEHPGVDATADAPPTAQAVLSAPDVIVLPAGSADLEDLADREQPDHQDHSRHHARRRLFVAGLTSTA